MDADRLADRAETNLPRNNRIATTALKGASLLGLAMGMIAATPALAADADARAAAPLSLIHISEPTRQAEI